MNINGDGTYYESYPEWTIQIRWSKQCTEYCHNHPNTLFNGEWNFCPYCGGVLEDEVIE